jgi:C4-dicarboxylate transporter DctQ subunit
MKVIRYLMTKANLFFDRLLDFMAILAMVILSFITLSVCAAVFSRYFLNRPMEWVPEISEYSLLYINFLVAAWVLRKDGHVRMDIFYNRLSPQKKCVTSLSTSIVAALVCLLITAYGIKVTRYLYSVGYYTPTILELPKFAIAAVIPVGFFVLFLQVTRNAFSLLKNLITSGYKIEEESQTTKIEDVK